MTLLLGGLGGCQSLQSTLWMHTYLWHVTDLFYITLIKLTQSCPNIIYSYSFALKISVIGYFSNLKEHRDTLRNYRNTKIVLIMRCIIVPYFDPKFTFYEDVFT